MECDVQMKLLTVVFFFFVTNARCSQTEMIVYCIKASGALICTTNVCLAPWEPIGKDVSVEVVNVCLHGPVGPVRRCGSVGENKRV